MLFGFDTKKKKILTMLTLIMLVGTSFFAGTVLATTPTTWADQPTYIGPGSMMIGAEYVVFIDDAGAICSKNGTSGKMVFRDSNASYVIQSTLNLLGASGGKVIIDEGWYKIDNTISIMKNGTVLSGVGHKTVLQMGDYINKPVIQAGGGTNKVAGAWQVKNIQINDLRVDGNIATNFNASGTNAPYAIYLNTVGYSSVSGCYVTNAFSDGIIVSYGSTYINVLNNHASGCSSGVTIDRGVNHATVIGNTLSSRYENGVTLFWVENVTVSGNSCEEIFCEASRNVVISGNTICRLGSVSNEGICLESRNRGIVISGNTIWATTYYGIRVSGFAPDGTPETVDDVSIDGNVIVGASLTQIGIQVEESRYGISITNNIIDKVSKYGINCLGTAVISGNTVNYTGRNAIVVSGPHSVVTDNKIDSASKFFHGIYASILLNGTCQNSTVVGNMIYNNPLGTRSNYCIQENESADYNLIANNVVVGYTVKGIGPASHTTLDSNVGYLTEISGTALLPTGTTTKVINHGLDTTPTIVLIMGSTVDTVSLYIDTITATQFTVHVVSAIAGNTTIYWYAEA